MASKKRQEWGVGSIFLIPLSDDSCCIGQVVGQERSALNSATIVIFDHKGRWETPDELPELSWDQAYSAIFVMRDALDSGRWKVIGTGRSAPLKLIPYEEIRSSGFIGAKILGSELAENFVNAFYGLEPWDDWYVPDYLDKFLLAPSKKPIARLVYCGRHKKGSS